MARVQVATASLLAIVILGVSGAAAAVSLLHLLTNARVSGYTYQERLAANPWDMTTVCLALFTAIPLVVLLANALLPRRLIAALVHNRVSAALLLLLSLLALLAVPALHVFANLRGYQEFTSSFNTAAAPIDQLAPASMQFLALMRAGPAVQPANGTFVSSIPDAAAPVDTDVGLKNPRTGADLAGGWITGPGTAKVTTAMALAMGDVAYAALAFRQQVMAMGVMEDVVAALTHGADYLTAAYDAQSGGLVSHVADGGADALVESKAGWRSPGEVPVAQREVQFVEADGPGTEVYTLGAPLLPVLAAVCWLVGLLVCKRAAPEISASDCFPPAAEHPFAALPP